MTDFTPSARYPDASVVVIDPSFEKYRLGRAAGGPAGPSGAA